MINYSSVMADADRNQALKELYDAFGLVEKPVPLATYEGSYCDEEVDVFNSTDWEYATYSDYLDGEEGAIICPPITKVYLLPRLFRMVMLRQHGKTNGAVDNLAITLETWPVEEDVECLLSDGQKAAIVTAWNHLDRTIYSPSGSHVGRELAKHWKTTQR